MRCSRRVRVAVWAALCWMAAAAMGGPVAAPATGELPGHYYLKGISEVGGELRLMSNGRFELGIAYGAVDILAQGRWAAAGDRLELVTDTPPPPSLTLGERRPEFVVPMEQPVVMEVRVNSPRLGLNWSNMEITAEFTNGLTRSGTTGRAGQLGFLVRDDDVWRNATVRRVSVAYPRGQVGPVWFNVDAATKVLVVHFEPGSLNPPPFETMVLEVQRSGDGRVALVQQGAERRALVFEK